MRGIITSRKSILLIGSDPSYLINFRSELISELILRGYTVNTAAWKGEDETLARLEKLGVEKHFEIPVRQGSLNLFHELALLFSIYNICRQTKPNAIIAYTAKPVVGGLLAAWMAGTPQRVALVEGLGYAFIAGAGLKRHLARHLLSAAYRVALRRAHRIIVLNSSDQDFISRLVRRSSKQILLLKGIGVSSEYFMDSPLPLDKVSFLYVGRILKDKGIRELLAASARLKMEGYDFAMNLVGPLDCNPAALSRAEFARLLEASGATWHGPQNNVRTFLEQASVLVLPSYREGFPRVVMEAMAGSRPVITTDTPGCADAVEHGEHGFLVKPRDEVGLAEAMARFIANPGLTEALGRRAREKAEREFVATDRAAELADLAGL